MAGFTSGYDKLSASYRIRQQRPVVLGQMEMWTDEGGLSSENRETLRQTQRGCHEIEGLLDEQTQVTENDVE